MTTNKTRIAQLEKRITLSVADNPSCAVCILTEDGGAIFNGVQLSKTEFEKRKNSGTLADVVLYLPDNGRGDA